MGTKTPRLKKRVAVEIAATAVVDRRARIGAGTVVWHFAQVMHGAEIGKNCVIGNGAFIDRHVVVGNNVKIHNKALVYRGVKIGDDCFIGPGACLANDPYPRHNKTRPISKPRWAIGRGASIGAGAIVLSDVTVGAYSLVGAGAVVTKDVPDYAVVAGNPARIIGTACRCGRTVRHTAKGYYCDDCKKYITV